MRVLVCGGRAYADARRVDEVLHQFHVELVLRPDHTITTLIEGGQTGADRLAKQWAERNGIPVEEYRADWNRHGSRAGPMRNARMLVEGKPDLVIAFPGGSGTANMVKQARAAGVAVLEVH